MLLKIDFPAWLKPEIIPGLPVRWYGLMYLFAFAAAYLLYRRQVKERNFPMSDDDLSSLFFWGILGLLLGARIFSTLIYETSDIYRRSPWLVFWPFQNGKFTGLQGMSYHGGVIGGIAGFTIYCFVKKYDVREIADMFAASIPLGYTFGRLGNFINGELWGRVTSSSIGMVFPAAPPFPASLPWVKELAEKSGTMISNPAGFVNLPRYPSQLFEALFEGVVLWAIIWFFRNRKPFKGFLASLYLGGYGLIRFFIEYFREPDAELGYRVQLGRHIGLEDIARFHPALSFSTGQLLCLGMIALAALWALLCARLPDSAPVRLYPGREAAPQKSEEAKHAEKQNRRKLRRRLNKR